MDGFVVVPLSRVKEAVTDYSRKYNRYNHLVKEVLNSVTKNVKRTFFERFILGQTQMDVYFNRAAYKPMGKRLSEEGHISEDVGKVWDKLVRWKGCHDTLEKMLSVGCDPLYLSPQLAKFVAEFEGK